jgi:hypothetical protein
MGSLSEILGAVFCSAVSIEGTLQMDNGNEYWRRAKEAYDQAKQATNEKDRATWFQIAESFETLFRLAPIAVRNTGADLDKASGHLLH